MEVPILTKLNAMSLHPERSGRLVGSLPGGGLHAVLEQCVVGTALDTMNRNLGGQDALKDHRRYGS